MSRESSLQPYTIPTTYATSHGKYKDILISIMTNINYSVQAVDHMVLKRKSYSDLNMGVVIYHCQTTSKVLLTAPYGGLDYFTMTNIFDILKTSPSPSIIFTISANIFLVSSFFPHILC